MTPADLAAVARRQNDEDAAKGRLGLERQWLHAVGLGFEHPGTGHWVTFESAYPEDLQLALHRL